MGHPLLTTTDQGVADQLLRRKAVKFVRLFQGSRRVLELGSSTGTFLGLCAEAGIPAEGVEPFKASADQSRALYPHIPVHGSSALDFLGRAKASRFDGLYMSNVIEHMEVATAAKVLGLARQKLAPGSRIAISTANPECLDLMMKGFWADKEHVRPYAPRVLQELLEEAGFEGIRIQEDEDSRPQGILRSMVRRLRSALVGRYFGAPEIYAIATTPLVTGKR